MVRIQLASNFQVVELTYENWKEIDYNELEEATILVNKLGAEVLNETKCRTSKKAKKEIKPEDRPSESQIKYAVNCGCDEVKARTMTKRELWSFINEHKNDK